MGWVRLLMLGDIHGNIRFLDDYIFPLADALGVDAIVQLGDYGYWEHEPSGVLFNDAVMDACARYNVPLYFLRGNHDKLSHLLETYGHNVTDEGFIEIRPRVYYIPDGHTWKWGTCSFRAFGGAYSIDKDIRLDREKRKRIQLWAKETARREAGRPHKDVPDPAGTLWFPEEQLNDRQWKKLLGAEEPEHVDVLLSHDKPRSSNTGSMRLKDDIDCWPNQHWLQRAITLHTPKLHMHGHLHHRYSSSVRCGDDDKWCTVMGLACDWDAAPRFVRPEDAWAVLDIDVADVPLQVTPGNHPSLDLGQLVDLEGSEDL